MQNAYAGDIGDFAKYGLLRALCGERKLGVAWYLHPSQPRVQSGGDGRFTQYLLDAARWSALDPKLFAANQELSEQNQNFCQAVLDEVNQEQP